MEKILSILLLITFFNCVASSMDKVTVDSSSSTTIYPQFYSNNYFYIYNKNSKSTIYFYIRDKDNDLYYDNIYVCFTDTSPDDSNVFNTCANSDRSISKYGTVTDGSYTYYLYKYSYSPYRRYLIIGYSVKYVSGSLEVQASYSDIDGLVSSLIGTALSVLAIIGIVVGSIIVLSIIITILCCCCACCSCCARTTTVGTVGYIQPPPSVVISNPTAVPMVNQTPHYI